MNCIDVSEWNGDIDWTAVKSSGIDYAMIRCGFGHSGIDKYFNINLEKATAAGIKVGVYFYSYASDYDTACTEAKHCIELIEDYKNLISLPVFYDVEEEKCKSRITDVCMGFINTMQYYGYNVGVYTTISWYDTYFRDIACDYIWLASWGADDGEPHTAPEYCDIWQFTSKGTVPGVGTSCVDCDFLNNEDMKLMFTEQDLNEGIIEEKYNATVTIRYKDNKPINFKIDLL